MSVSENYNRYERKERGIFYTPKFLADYLAQKIIDFTHEGHDISILDPASGDGRLLRSLVNKAASKGIKISNIIGIDRDKSAIEKSKIIFQENYSKYVSNLIETDSVKPYGGSSVLDGWNSIKSKTNSGNDFDIVISNPPWGANLDYDSKWLSDQFSSAQGQYDIYNLFIELTINNLREGGVYGFILPDSIFNQEQSRLRKFLLSETSIHLIVRLGEKIFPEINRACVIIVGSKQIISNNQINCLRLSSEDRKKVLTHEVLLDEIEQTNKHKVPQGRFIENNDYLFDIDLKVHENHLIKKIEAEKWKLKRFIDNYRGAEISKKGTICRCYLCDKWIPYPKSIKPTCPSCKKELDPNILVKEKIVSTSKSENEYKFITGEDIYRFTSFPKNWIDITKEGLNYKDINIYKGSKILVRKTGLGVTACIDYNDCITSQVVYILKLKSQFEKVMSLEFILAILNSRLITYYLLKEYGENEWKSHPYLTQTMLLKLPIPQMDFEIPETKKIITDITTLIREEVQGAAGNRNISREKDIFIEKAIAKLYGLNEKDYDEIFKTLVSADPLIPIKRLLNINPSDIFRNNGI